MGVFTRGGGGGGGHFWGFDAKFGGFPAVFLIFSLMSVGLLVKTWDPPILDVENPKIKVSG